MGSNKNATCHIQIKGEGKSRSEEIDLFPFVVGRGEEADIQILASGVSRSHISVSLRENSLWIEDLGSANGTFLNDKQLIQKVPTLCKEGDSIRLGLNNDILTFSLVEERNPEHHVVSLPPLPQHAPETIEPVHIAPQVAPLAPVQPPPIPITVQKVVPKLEKVKPFEVEAPVVQANDLLEKAKADALEVKISAETEAAKTLQMAREMAHEEVSKAREEAAQIVTKASDQAYRLQREGEAAATKLRQAMQETISKLHSETEDKVENTLKEARLSAASIKGKAQTEADDIISKAFQKALEIKNKGEEAFKALQKEEKKKRDEILEKTQQEADKILEESHGASIKIRANIDKEIADIKFRIEKDAQKQCEEALSAARLEAERTQKEVQKKNEEVIGATRIEAERIKKEAQKQSEEALSTARMEGEKIRKETRKYSEEARKNIEEKIKTVTLEAEKIKNEALKTAQKISEEVLRTERASHLNTFEKENKNLADTLLAAQTSLKNLEEEKGRLHDSIESYKKTEAKLIKDIEENKKKLAKENDELKSTFSHANDDLTARLKKEQEDFKAHLLKERDDFKVQVESDKNKMTLRVTEEEKQLREKAKADFYIEREALEAEFAKSRIKEISKALEIYIIPRLKEGLNWEEIPKPLNNFSSDLRDIVKKVMTGDFSEMVADTAMDTSVNHVGSSKRAKALLYLTIVSGVTVLALMAHNSLQDPTSVLRKPASQIYSKFQKPALILLTTTEEYKSSYTDNVLYTKGYMALKLNSKSLGIWKAEIDNFFTNNLGLEKTRADKFIELESQLVHNLAELRTEIKTENKTESIQRMATLEKLSVDQFIDVLGGQQNYNTFRDLEKNYIERNRLPANQD